MEQKRRWCQEIKRLILETYKGKIPDKVKSLVMELGRNHDDGEGSCLGWDVLILVYTPTCHWTNCLNSDIHNRISIIEIQ